MELNRRSLITGLIAFAVTAPAIVRAGSLMPVKVWIDPPMPRVLESFDPDPRCIYWLGPDGDFYYSDRESKDFLIMAKLIRSETPFRVDNQKP